MALTVYWGEIDAVSHWLGAIVGVREAIYVALTLAALYVQPAYLLVGVNATLRQGNPVCIELATCHCRCPLRR